ncbi:PD-(D/E)XK nuclease family protein [Marinibacterium sp. SX1]|uniref:PD-(D/E)XK nuclease family protein n=1 Tax=Marinibacterium sp. SX1 TaxID=3388424 RepID=UPI003D1768C4
MRIDPLMTRNPATGATRHVTDDLLAGTYLAPRLSAIDLQEAIGSGGPWAESHKVAAEETSRAVESGLLAVARATSTLDPSDLRPEALPDSRARTHLTGLRDLWRDLGQLPGPLQTWHHVIRSAASDALEALPVLGDPCAFATPAEAALDATLRAHHGAVAQPRAASRAADGTALRYVQDNLGLCADRVTPDDGIACFGLRDPREEAEFAAARAQAMLQDGTVETARQIGLLVPDDPAYAQALPDAFDRAGLPLSGLPRDEARRDTAGALLSLLLVILAGPAPRTAMASLYVAGGMPWPAETGRRMAREVIDRGYSRSARQLGGPSRQLLDALRPCETPAQLFGRLGAIARAVPHLDLQPRIAALASVTGDAIDWPLLRRRATPRDIGAQGHDRFVEGISLFTESALPWRPVRQLIVLGMAGRHWPRQPGTDPFFTEAEIATIRSSGLLLAGRQQKLERGLALMRRQLGAARDGLTLLVPALDLGGVRQAPSTGMALIAHLLGRDDPAGLVQDVRRMPPGKRPVALSATLPVPGNGAPDLPADGLIHLQRGLGRDDRPGTNLLRLRSASDGQALPQSPSRLETLLVSPLAWLLEELDATDRTWAPEALDAMTMGTLMHQVLEDIFTERAPVPPDDAILARVPEVLHEVLSRHADWLLDGAWATERRNLEREARTICLAWAGFLRRSGAVILHNEMALRGDHAGLLLNGKADCLLELPDGRILVVDHKRARAKGRRERMSRGWDLQVALYRAMLERPDEETELTRLVQGGARVVTAYHMLMDGTVLSDADGAGLTGVECAADDASANAIDHLARVLAEVGMGTIRLNRHGDAQTFAKDRGLPAYALANPLVAAFCLPDQPDEMEARS